VRSLETSDHKSKWSESGKEHIGIGRDMFVLVMMVRITWGSCREEGAGSGSERIGVLDLSNNPAGISVFTLALDARGDGGRLGKAFCLDSSSLRLCGFNCP